MATGTEPNLRPRSREGRAGGGTRCGGGEFLYLMLAKKGDGCQWATTNP
jgi:hypothetical protein